MMAAAVGSSDDVPASAVKMEDTLYFYCYSSRAQPADITSFLSEPYFYRGFDSCPGSCQKMVLNFWKPSMKEGSNDAAATMGSVVDAAAKEEPGSDDAAATMGSDVVDAAAKKEEPGSDDAATMGSVDAAAKKEEPGSDDGAAATKEEGSDDAAAKEEPGSDGDDDDAATAISQAFTKLNNMLSNLFPYCFGERCFNQTPPQSHAKCLLPQTNKKRPSTLNGKLVE